MSATASLRRREIRLEDLTGLDAVGAIARLRELELRPAVEPCDTDRPEQHGLVLGHEPSADSSVRRTQLITLLVGQHADVEQHRPMRSRALASAGQRRGNAVGPDHGKPRRTGTDPRNVVRALHREKPDAASAPPLRSSAVSPSLPPVAHVSQPRLRSTVPPIPRTDMVQGPVRRSDERSVVAPVPARRKRFFQVVASVVLGLALAAASGLVALQMLDGPAPHASQDMMSRSTAFSAPASSPKPPSRLVRATPPRVAPRGSRTAPRSAVRASANAETHPATVASSDRGTVPAESAGQSVSPAPTAVVRPGASADPPGAQEPALPPSPTGPLPGPPPT